MRIVTAGVLAASMVVAAGCGSDTQHVSQADVQGYATLSRRSRPPRRATEPRRAGRWTRRAASPPTASYDAQVRPMVDRMRSMSGAMDQQMGRMGRAEDGDMSCGVDAMGAELDHHDAVACTSTAMSANHAEATRHAAAMTGWADHQHARADEMGGMMGDGERHDGSGGGTTTVACHRNGDGTFTLGP